MSEEQNVSLEQKSTSGDDVKLIESSVAYNNKSTRPLGKTTRPLRKVTRPLHREEGEKEVTTEPVVRAVQETISDHHEHDKNNEEHITEKRPALKKESHEDPPLQECETLEQVKPAETVERTELVQEAAHIDAVQTSQEVGIVLAAQVDDPAIENTPVSVPTGAIQEEAPEEQNAPVTEKRAALPRVQGQRDSARASTQSTAMPPPPAQPTDIASNEASIGTPPSAAQSTDSVQDEERQAASPSRATDLEPPGEEQANVVKAAVPEEQKEMAPEQDEPEAQEAVAPPQPPVSNEQAADKTSHPLSTGKQSPAAQPTRSFPARARVQRVPVSLVLLALLLVSAASLLRDIEATHVYAYNLSPTNGAVLAQHDLGGYQANLSLSLPVSTGPGMFLEARDTNTKGDSHILQLTSAGTLLSEQPVSAGQVSFSAGTGATLFLAGDHQLQSVSPQGQVLWQQPLEQPARGAHHFQPVIDDTAVYSVQASEPVQVVAYGLHDGVQRWTTKLDDSVAYMPPPVVENETLYIASDHTIYALHTQDGTIVWQQRYTARTLLLEREGQSDLLVAVGAQGLQAFDGETGRSQWSFHHQVNNDMTPEQFYQAALAQTSAGTIIYTTGISWQMLQARQYVWLYAIRANTGTLLWSRPLGMGFASADAARSLTPLADELQGLVVAQGRCEQSTTVCVKAFDALSGSPRWSTTLDGLASTSSSLASTPAAGILLLASSSQLSVTLRIWSLLRLLLLLLCLLSILGLILLWRGTIQRGSLLLLRVLRSAPADMRYIVKRARSGSINQRRRVLLALLVIIVVAAAASYGVMARPRTRIYQLASETGHVQWRREVALSMAIVGAGTNGGFIEQAAGEGDGLHQLQALSPGGQPLWHTFASEGAFLVPAVATRPGTALVALTGRNAFPYRAAPLDPAYPQQIDHLLTLMLLNRATGATIWQRIITYPDEEQRTTILGADAHFIYLAGAPDGTIAAHSTRTMQLLAVDEATGMIAWRIFAGSIPPGEVQDNGTLLTEQGQMFWRVADNLYAIDTDLGQIEWHRFLSNAIPSLPNNVGRQLAAVAGVLVVACRDGVHAFDPATGEEVWRVPTAPAQRLLTDFVAAGNKLVLTDGAELQAFDVRTQRPLWSQSATAGERLGVSDDAGTIYTWGGAGETTLRAIDANNGAARWNAELPNAMAARTLQPLANVRGSNIFISCLAQEPGGCLRERLYAFDSASGRVRWQFDGAALRNLSVSANEEALLFQADRSAWANLFD